MVWLGYLLVEVRVPFIWCCYDGRDVWMFYFNVIIFLKLLMMKVDFVTSIFSLDFSAPIINLYLVKLY
jgi:hypothetical protein